MKRIIGGLMLLAVFAVLFAITVAESGIKVAAIMWIVSLAITLMIIAGAWLLIR